MESLEIEIEIELSYKFFFFFWYKLHVDCSPYMITFCCFPSNLVAEYRMGDNFLIKKQYNRMYVWHHFIVMNLVDFTDSFSYALNDK